MKKLFLLLFFLITFSSFASLEIEEIIFIPPEFYVGDLVTAEISFYIDPEMEIEIPDPLPDANWLEIDSMSINRDNTLAKLTINFTPFQTGIRTMPDIQLGEVVISDFKVSTTSLLDENGSELRGLRDPLYLPGTKVFLVITIIFLFVAPFVFYYLARKIFYRVKRILQRISRRKPYKVLNRLVFKLETENKEIDDKDFYTELSDGMREYLSRKSNYDFHTATTKEIARFRFIEIKRESREGLIELFHKSDRVKFAGETASISERKENLSVVKSISEQIEKEEDRNVDV